MNLTRFRTTAFCALLGIAAAASAQDAQTKTLYERLGGIHKIAMVVDTAVRNCAKEPVLMANKNFAMANSFPVPAIDFFLTGYIASKTGGPQMYSGPSAASIEKWFMLTPEQQAKEDMIINDAMKSVGIDQMTIDDYDKWWADDLAKAEPMQPKPEMIMDKDSLYGRLGGIVPIAVVVDDFVNNLAMDKTITANPHVVAALTDGHITPQGLKYLLTEQLASAAGGPYKYSGRSMADSHKGLMISEDEWNAGAKILVATLDKYNVPKKEQGEILTIVSSTKPDIVGK